MNFLTINHENRAYIIDVYASLEQLLKLGELLELPLFKWVELFENKDGRCDVDTLRKVLLAKIESYDNSTAVNQFTFKGIKSWLDKNTRVGLMNLANCTQGDLGLVLEDQVLTLPAEVVKQCLIALEVYAGQCYLVTAKHALNANKLETVEDLVNYDYTQGYPEQLNIE